SDLVLDETHVVHNTYLELLAELGPIGLGCFLALVGASLGLGWRAVRAFARTGRTDLELIGRGVLVGLCGMLAASVFLSAEYEKQLWLLLGFAAALAGLAEASPSASRERSEEHTSELQSHLNLVCRLLLEKKKIC